MTENLVLSVIITASNMASQVLASFGADAMASLGLVGGAAVGVGVAIAAIGAASIGAATGYDQAMHKISALTDTNAEQLAYYNQQILALGPSMDMSAEQMAKALYYIVSANLDPLGTAMQRAANNIDVLKYSAMAATAGMADQSTIADALTSVLNAYADSNLQAGNAIDVLNTMVSNGKMDWHSFVSTIGIGATTAQAAGLSFNEFAASMATLSGVVGNHGIRRMSNDLQNLMRSLMSVDDVSKRTSAQLKAMGIADAASFTTINQAAQDAGLSFNAMAYSSMSFIDKLKYLAQLSGFKDYNSDRMKNIQLQANQIANTQGEAAAQAFLNYQLAEGSAKFEKLVGGAAAFLPALVLLQQGGATYAQNLASMTEKAEDFGTKVTRSFNIMRESTGQQLKMLGLALQNIFVVMGLQLLPYVNQIATAFRGVALSIVGLLQLPGAFNQVASAVRGLGIVILAVLAGPLTGLLMAAAPIVGAVMGIIATGILMGKVIDIVMAHWGDILKIIHPYLIVLQKDLQQVEDAMRKAFANPQVQAAIKQIQAELPNLMPVLQAIGMLVGVVLYVSFQQFIALLSGLAVALPGIVTWLSGLMMFLGGMVSFFKDLVTGNWKNLGNDLQEMGKGILTGLSGLWSAITGMLGGYFEHWLELAGTSGGKLKAQIAADWQGMLNWIGGAFSRFGSAVQRFGSDVSNAVTGFARNLVNGVINGFHWLYEHNWYFAMFVILFTRMASEVGMLVGGFFNGLGTLVHNGLTAIGNLWSALTTPIGNFFSWLGTQANQTWTNFLTSVGLFATALQSTWNLTIVQPIENMVSSLVNNALSWGENIIKNLIQGIQNMLPAAGKVAQDVFNQIKGWLGFHSPPPNAPEAGMWGYNMANMLAQSMQSGIPQVTAQAHLLLQGIAAVMPQPAPTTSTAGVALSSSGNGGTIIHAVFPNVTSREELKAAFDDLATKRERSNYRTTALQSGTFTGLRAGV